MQRWLAGMVLAGALVLPATAQAHGDEEHGVLSRHGMSAAERHRAADLADVPVRTLERRVRRIAKRLGYRPGDRFHTRAGRLKARAAQVSADPGVSGQWSAVQPMPVIPIFTALLPNGKILMWDSVGDNATETYADQSFTRAAVYDPATNTSKSVNVSGYNLFCAGYVQLANGNVFVAGGNADQALNGLRQTHVFDWQTETWSRGPDMQDGRWYPSVASLPNDEAIIVGGGPTSAEVRTTNGSLRRLTGFTTPSSREYPFLQAATDGRALLLGPPTALSLIDASGAGTLAAFGNRDAVYRSYGSYALYDVGRALVTGGGSVSEDGLTGVPTRTAVTVNTLGGAPVAAPTSSMAFRRRQSNLTVLADGTVLVSGGQSTNGAGGYADVPNAVFGAELWSPATGTWTTLASASVARLYHSIAILLPDGRVLNGGGGICGECQRVGYLRRDAQIFSPPYLFRKDGSGALATRPAISSAPASVGYGGSFAVGSAQAASIRKVALVRLGAPTHGQDQSQRYVPLAFSVSGGTLTVSGPNNPNEAPAGHYMLFLVDAAGVPSVARIVSVQRPGAPPASTSTNLALGKAATGSAACNANEGPAKAVNGSVSGGNADKWCSTASGTRQLTVDLGSAQTVSTFVVRHAEAGGEAAALNTRAFRIQTRTGTSGTFTTVATVTANTAAVSTVPITARSARQIRLVVDQAEQGTGGAARIYEFEAYAGSPGAFTAAAPTVLYSAQNASGRSQRFEAGAYDATRGNLGQVGNDATRSLDVATGYSATVCSDPAFGGTCTTFGPGRTGVMPAGLDGTASSVRVMRTG